MSQSLKAEPNFTLVSAPNAAGFNNDEAWGFLAGIISEDPLTAAANAGQTGAMIALVPAPEEAARLALEGGEEPDQLHLTLLFLGEASAISLQAREKILDSVARYAAGGALTAQAFAANVFNPAGDSPCLVLGVGNDDGGLDNLHSNISSTVGGMSGFVLPEQHNPWVPHVTLAYTDDFSQLSELPSRMGPVVFDRIRVAFADTVHDIPLTPGEGGAMEPDEVEFVDSRTEASLMEFASDRGLRRYWTKGEGAVKIGWGTDGSFDRCVSHLGKYVSDPQGLCAEYHKAATGEWPAEKGVESAVEPLVAHGNHKQEDHGNWADGPGTRSGSDKSEVSAFVQRLKRTGAEKDKAAARTKLRKRLADLERDELGDISDELGIDEDEISGSRRQIVEQLIDRILNASVTLAASIDLSTIILTAAQAVQQAEDEPWEGVLTVEGIESGDGRLFNLGSLDWADLPMPLMYQPASVGGHDASVLAGAITYIVRKKNQVFGRGHVFGNMLAGEYGEGIRNMMSTGGVSVDVDSVKDADVEMVYEAEAGLMSKPSMTIFNRGRIRGATLVAFPAFVEAKLNFVGEALTACGCIQDSEGYVLTAASGDKSHTITIPDLPDPSWFNEPTDVEMHGAFTITDEGRVFGFVAPSGVRHRSVDRYVPMGNVDYERWMSKETIVAGGGRVKTGVVTMDCGHAATDNYGSLANRRQHYDDSCSVFANVRVGEWPGKGVWFAGALRHGVNAEQVSKAMGCQLSGDWQPLPERPGTQELIAALLVPVPGFPKERAQASVVMEDGVMVASSVPVEFCGDMQEAMKKKRKQNYEVDELEQARSLIAQFKSVIMADMGLDPASRKAAIMKELGLE